MSSKVDGWLRQCEAWEQQLATAQSKAEESGKLVANDPKIIKEANRLISQLPNILQDTSQTQREQIRGYVADLTGFAEAKTVDKAIEVARKNTRILSETITSIFRSI